MKIIIPAAGLSTRYKSSKPKYLLTHPCGRLMIELVLESLRNNVLNPEIAIIILSDHNKLFNAELVLRQIAKSLDITLEILILDHVTTGPAETIYKYLLTLDVDENFLIKDADNIIEFTRESVNSFEKCDGFLLGGDIAKHAISEIHQKSFIICEPNGHIKSFIEKRVVSNLVCFGLYGFKSSKKYLELYDLLISSKFSGERFVSQIVQLAILNSLHFEYREAIALKDWGVWDQWIQERKKFRTLFIDFDGVIVKSSGKYGVTTWDDEFMPIPDNIKLLKELADNGSQIVITTARPESFRSRFEAFFGENRIKVTAFIFDLFHSERILINDFADSNPYPSATALNLVRNGDLMTFDDVLRAKFGQKEER
jgi:hypothetical protein